MNDDTYLEQVFQALRERGLTRDDLNLDGGYEPILRIVRRPEESIRVWKRAADDYRLYCSPREGDLLTERLGEYQP